jgi:subtilisin family serine protease
MATLPQPAPCRCFVVPPSYLKKLAASSDPDVAAAAARTLRINASMSAFRAQLSLGAPSPAAAKRTGLRRQVFNCSGTTDLPGDPLRMEGDPGGEDAAADEAYGHLKSTWDFYNVVFGRQSVDGAGKTLVASVHYGQNYLNAFWNGQQMVFGDGDEKTLTHFTGSLDVIAHELTHGVTGFSAQLAYEGETGALNESMSDVFGSLVKQWSLGQTVDEADWLIGAGVLGANLHGRALRDMADPGTAFDGDEQPGHMRDYVRTDDDHGGVHINSGIPNKAFVLAARAIGGKAWEKIGKVWYKTLTERLTSSADFAKCASETVSAARDLFPDDASIAAKIAQAWVDVGVLAALPASIAAPAVLRVAASVAPVAVSEAALQAKFAGMGSAKVLVALNPDLAAAAASVRAIDPTQAIMADLGRYFVSAPESLALAIAPTRRGRPSPPSSGMKVFPRLGLALGIVSAEGLTGLRAHRRVKSVLPAPSPSLVIPVRVQAAKAPTRPTWGLERINAPAAWKNGVTGEGVIVGHLDTGVDGDHPALKDAIAAFAEFDFNGNQVAGTKPYDSARHGTHTAGTIVGRAVGRGGAIGVAPGAKLVSAHCIEGGQVIDRILAGLEWIVGQHARVLSMSVGLPGYTPAFEELIAALRRNGVLPVIAIGNEGPGTSRSPGNYANVLSVGAIDKTDAVADFSSSETFNRPEESATPLLAAPGVDVLSSVPGGLYDLDSGTSMATPHVAGLAALLFQSKPGATIDEVEAAILNSCALPATWTTADRGGRGVPDAVRAIANLGGKAAIAAAPKRRAHA